MASDIRDGKTKTDLPDYSFPTRQVKAPTPKSDWAEKTHSSWDEHSGFIETSKVANLAPPPRLDPRLVKHPKAPQARLGSIAPSAKVILTVFVLAAGVGLGLYFNGALDPYLKHPSSMADTATAGSSVRAPAATEAAALADSAPSKENPSR